MACEADVLGFQCNATGNVCDAVDSTQALSAFGTAFGSDSIAMAD